MASPGELKRLENRVDSSGQLPNPPLQLEPLPPELIKAFPAMKDWENRNNRRISDWIAKQNTAQQSV